MSSVERVVEYGDTLPKEKPLVVADAKPPRSWPSHGHVVFTDVVLRYRPELDPALNRLTVTFNGGERVAVVGRTGGAAFSACVSGNVSPHSCVVRACMCVCVYVCVRVSHQALARAQFRQHCSVWWKSARGSSPWMVLTSASSAWRMYVAATTGWPSFRKTRGWPVAQ